MWWIRRDLRAVDNEALTAARRRDGEAIAVFCEDPAFGVQTARSSALREALGRLEGTVGGILRVQGDPVEEIVKAAAAAGVREVHATGDSGPYGRIRDGRVGEALGKIGIDFVVSGSNYLVAPGTIRNAKGAQMRTFSGFKKAWMKEIRGKAGTYAPLGVEGEAY